MSNGKAKSERRTSARAQAATRRTIDMSDVLGMRHLQMITVEQDVPEPKPGDAASGERSELFERQEAEMRKVFGLPPDWRMDDLQPEKPKRGGK